jgi:Alpha/beta hydrolase domain
MSRRKAALFGPSAWVSVACTVALLIEASPAQARVKKIVIDKRVSPAFEAMSGPAAPYETIAGRAYGELDPNDPHNAIITDIRLAPRNANGKVEYMATFFLVKPIDMSKSSHLMWQEVPNRGGRITIGATERNMGDVGLSSGWQGDNMGTTAQAFPNANDYAVVPVAKNPDGSPISGTVTGRIFNVSGDSQPMLVYANTMPYRPASLDTRKATIITHASETIDGVVGGVNTIASGDWAWASCSAANPFPGTPDPTRVCLKNGFNPALNYYVVFTAQDPYVLGIGFAAFRDVGSFFKNETADDAGTPNPVAKDISWVIGRGRSQSGNFLKAFLHQGFNQDEAGRQVHDGSWPIIAAGQLPLNVRFGLPDGVPRLYGFEREAPQWWAHAPDPVRKRPANGILDRCTATHTCPKIVETFGGAEMWYLKMPPSLVGTAADADIPLPSNVRRYYISSSPHGGGPGGFSVNPLASPNGSGTNWGACVLAANPMPYTQTSNALQVAFRNWVMKGMPMPPSRYPTLSEHTLAAPTKQALGFPTIPGLPPTAPTGLINPAIEYDFGPGFNPNDQTGIITVQPPTIKQVIKMVVPRVDADGNELGGVPVVLRDAPLGTYLGWNITAAGMFKDKICSFTGGMIPFAKTKTERTASGDPRLSLEERYASHDGYVAAVRAAAGKAVAQGFLLQADATALIEQAAASNVLNP